MTTRVESLRAGCRGGGRGSDPTSPQRAPTDRDAPSPEGERRARSVGRPAVSSLRGESSERRYRRSPAAPVQAGSPYAYTSARSRWCPPLRSERLEGRVTRSLRHPPLATRPRAWCPESRERWRAMRLFSSWALVEVGQPQAVTSSLLLDSKTRRRIRAHDSETPNASITRHVASPSPSAASPLAGMRRAPANASACHSVSSK